MVPPVMPSCATTQEDPKRVSARACVIAEVRSVRNPWHAGWGIRWFPGRYLLWSVSGFQAVEVVTKDGNRFRIGTDEPEMLVQAIQTNTMMYQKQSLRKSI